MTDEVPESISYEEWVYRINNPQESDDSKSDEPDACPPIARKKERGVGLKRRKPVRYCH